LPDANRTVVWGKAEDDPVRWELYSNWVRGLIRRAMADVEEEPTAQYAD
jgi:hypothetical protein